MRPSGGKRDDLQMTGLWFVYWDGFYVGSVTANGELQARLRADEKFNHGQNDCHWLLVPEVQPVEQQESERITGLSSA